MTNILAMTLDVPADLSEHDQWVLWRYVLREGRRSKVPCRTDGGYANVTNPIEWSSFEQAMDALKRFGRRYEGLGFVFTQDDPFAGIDLDNALSQDGEVKGWAQGIVERFADTYMEVSPSGKGLKLWARGSLPSNLPGVRIEDGAIELYDHARYFAVTGRAYRGAALEVTDHAADLLDLYVRLTAGRDRHRPRPTDSGRIPQGHQHNTLVSICGTLRLRGVCEEAIEACLQIVNAKQCEKPGPSQEISRIVRSSRGWRRP
jgi:hypothetical protein